MKKILMILLLTIPLYAISQTTKPIEAFSGIRFGSSQAIVLAAMKAKGAGLDKENSEKDILVFDNVKTGGRDATMMVKFVNNQAFEASYIFSPDVERKVIGLYNDLVADYTGVYGQGQVTKEFKSPYEAGEDESTTLTGLGAGSINFSTLWVDNTKNNAIAIDINTDMLVTVKYQNIPLVRVFIAKQKEANKSDL